MIMINKRSRESMNSWMNDISAMNKQNRTNTLDIHPDDADTLKLHQGQLVRIKSKINSIDAPVNITPGGRRGVVAIAHGWGGGTYNPVDGKATSGHGANRNRLVDRHILDPISQVPSFNAVPVKIEAISQNL